MLAGVMTGLEELRRDMTKRIDRVEERAHRGQEKLRDELTHVKSQARVDQAQLIRNTDQCLAESLVQATKESYERDFRMTREIERLLTDHDNTYAHTMTSLEKRLNVKPDLMIWKLDEILQGRQLLVKGLLDTGAVVSVMPVSTWTDMGFDRSDLIPTNIRLATANQGAIYVTGRTPIISLQLGGRHLWMSFLVVENLDESDQFILGRDFYATLISRSTSTTG